MPLTPGVGRVQRPVVVLQCTGTLVTVEHLHDLAGDGVVDQVGVGTDAAEVAGHRHRVSVVARLDRVPGAEEQPVRTAHRRGYAALVLLRDGQVSHRSGCRARAWWRGGGREEGLRRACPTACGGW